MTIPIAPSISCVTETPARALVALVEQALPRIAGGRGLRWSDRLSNLGFGSLQFLVLIVELEARYSLSSQDLGKLSVNITLGELARLCLPGQPSGDDLPTLH